MTINPIAPILEPTEIITKETRKVAEALANYENKSLPTSITDYEVPEMPETKDPRGLARRTKDSLLQKLLPKHKSAMIARRIDEDNLYARATTRYDWLKASEKFIGEALKRLQESYTNISRFMTELEEDLNAAERTIKQGEENIARHIQEMENLQKDLDEGALTKSLTEILGEEAAKQANKKLSDEIGSNMRTIWQTERENEYQASLIAKYTKVAKVCADSLRKAEPAIRRAQNQKQELQTKLYIYEGYTRNQVEIARAVRFLEDTQRVTDQLTGDMIEIDQRQTSTLEQYAIKAPGRRFALLPKPEERTLGKLKIPGQDE